MSDPGLERYINAKRLAGASDELIKNELLQNHWKVEQIDEALGVIKVPVPVSSPTHYLGMGELLTATSKKFTDRFKNSILIVLVPGIVLFFMSLGIGTLFALFSTGMTGSILNGANAAIMGIVLFLVAIFAFVFIIAIELWGGLALAYSFLSEDVVGFKEAYGKTRKLIRSYWWINALTLLIISSGALLLIIPAIIFGVWFVFSQFALIEDDAKGLKALMTSREYVKGYGWSIFARLLLFGFVLGILAAVWSGLIKSLGIEKNIFILLLNALINAAVSIYIISLMTTMFKNIKSLKGKVDVSGRSKVVWVILAVLGIFAFLGIPVVALLATVNPSAQMEKARQQRSEMNKLQIKNAVMRYYASKGTYPTTLDQLVPDELKTIPTDPDDKLCYLVSVNLKEGVLITETPKVGTSCPTNITSD